MRQRRWPVQHEGRASPSDVKTSLAKPESPPGLRERARQIEAEQVRLLYTQAPAGCVATVLNAGVVTFVLRKVVAHPLLIAWLALLIAIILSLFVLCGCTSGQPRQQTGVVSGTPFLSSVPALAAQWGGQPASCCFPPNP